MSGSTPLSVDSLRVRRMGGGAASSESESCSGLASEGLAVSSWGTLRECDLQKLKKLLCQLDVRVEGLATYLSSSCSLLKLTIFSISCNCNSFKIRGT